MHFFDRSKDRATDSVEPVESSRQTSDAEKGAQTNGPHDAVSDEESLSSNAQAGVKAVQAAASVWTKYHLIGAYVMFVTPFRSNLRPVCSLTPTQHLVDLLRHRPPRSRRPRHESLCHQCLPSALSYCRYWNHVLHHWRAVQDSLGQATRHVGSTSGALALTICMDGGIHHDGFMPECRDICCGASILVYRVCNSCSLPIKIRRC